MPGTRHTLFNPLIYNEPLALAILHNLVPLVFNGLFFTADPYVTVIHRILFFFFKSKNLYAINKVSNIKFS